MINIITLQGAKDILSQYPGDEYCVIGPTESVCAGFGYWLILIEDLERVIKHNEHEWTRKLYHYNDRIYDTRLYRKPNMIANIPDDIIHTLIDEGYLVPKISDKEWNVQVALGVAPQDRRYLIRNKVEK